MRIRFASKTHCAHLAKALKREIRATHPDIKLSGCQRAVARMMGYRNWGELEALSVPGVEPSPPDEALAEGERTARRRGFAEALARDLAVPLDRAAGIVDLIRPLGRRDVPAASVGVYPIEGDWGSGAAIVPPPGHRLSGTLFLVGLADGRIRCLQEPRAVVRDAAEAKRLYEMRAPWPSSDFYEALELLGYGFDGLPDDEAPASARARTFLERNLHADAFRCWRADPGPSTATYEVLRTPGEGAPRRIAFAKAYPSVAAEILGRSRRPKPEQLAFVEAFATPELALSDYLAREYGMEAERIHATLLRLRGIVVTDAPSVIYAYERLMRLPAGDLPRDQSDLNDFSACLRMIDRVFPHGMDDQEIRFLAMAKGDGDWGACRSGLRAMAKDACARAGAGLGARAFYGRFDELAKLFTYEVAVPAAALVDRRFEALYYGEHDIHPEAWEEVDEGALGSACSGLFLDGIGAHRLVALCGEAMRRKLGDGSFPHPPRLHPLDRDGLAALLEPWREWLAPAYRGIAVEGVHAHLEAEMRRLGSPIGRGRRRAA